MSAAASLCLSRLRWIRSSYFFYLSGNVDSLPQIAEYARGCSPNFAVMERNHVDGGD